MSTVVITGSTKGIGRGLAEQFARRGHNAVICSRNADDVERAAAAIDTAAQESGGSCTGIACDTTDKAQLQALWDHAAATHGSVDIWINNAGVAVSRFTVHELPEDLTRTLIGSNLLGTTFGSQVAVSGFRAQGRGALYNVLGGSFDGKRLVPNMGVYSATKAGIHLLTRYLIDENDNPEIVIGSISPGMLITENWFEEQKELSADEWQKIRPLLNVLCDHVDTVAPWLVEQVLANTRSGKRIAWMTGGKIAGRFFAARVLGRKRDLFSQYDL
jgi:NAD(P)-dependent dehydrogenase (short-subunit alcohol dehydrogenase family)